MVYYLDIVAIGTTLSWTRWLAGRSERFADWYCGKGGREALDSCGLTNLLEQTLVSVLACSGRECADGSKKNIHHHHTHVMSDVF